MLSLSRERVKGAFQGRRHRRNSVGWSRGSWETKDTDRASDSEAQRSGSQFSKQIFRHFCHWCLEKETNITIESFHISQISFFRPPFLALMNYVEAANLSSHPIFLSLGSAWRRSCLQVKSVSKSCLCLGDLGNALSLLDPSSPSIVCPVAIFMMGCLVIIEPQAELEITWDRSWLAPSVAFNGLYSTQQNINMNLR